MQDMEDNTKDKEEPNCSVKEFIEEIQDTQLIQHSMADSAEILSKNEQVAKQLANQDKDTDIKLKKLYGWGILGILVIWEIFVICFSWKQLTPCDLCVKKVSDTVFVALLTSATANILALPAIILNYLFPKKK